MSPLLAFCYRETGHRLGLPVGTLAARLTRARTLLQARLTRQGLALPGALVASLLVVQTANAFTSAKRVRDAVALGIGLGPGRPGRASTPRPRSSPCRKPRGRLPCS